MEENEEEEDDDSYPGHGFHEYDGTTMGEEAEPAMQEGAEEEASDEPVDDHKIKMDAMRLKIRKIRKYAINKEAWYHYAIGSIITIVAILIAFVVAFKCFS